MPFEITDNNQTYCWLRCMLEPRFTVVAEPDSAYYSEFQYCYRILNGDTVVREFRGDFRDLQPQQLVIEAREFVASVGSQMQPLPTPKSSAPEEPADDLSRDEPPVVASRLHPLRTDVTYFSSGRAAFTFLLSDLVRPRRVWLPTFVCWSLIAAMQSRFPGTRLLFYSVDRNLRCRWPKQTEPGDAIVFIHYFGHISETPAVPEHCTPLEDVSHLLILPERISGQFAFGSLRKSFRIADGGLLLGRHCPVYETDDGLAVWLRANSRDWKDLREAENMMDRRWSVSDMSSQSLAMMLSCDRSSEAEQRRRNQRYLRHHFPAGRPLVEFAADEIPLLQNVLMPDEDSRNSLRAFLASRAIFCSIHWPLHPLLRERSNEVDSTDAAWLEQHVLSIPVADDFSEARMAAICEAAEEWLRAGG